MGNLSFAFSHELSKDLLHHMAGNVIVNVNVNDGDMVNGDDDCGDDNLDYSYFLDNLNEEAYHDFDNV